MDGIGVPLVTPFDVDGDVSTDRLRELITWLQARGVDFLVPCGTTGEAELLTGTERATVIETVTEAATVPVVAGTGHPGRRETVRATSTAAEAGADAALVVTPFYFDHDQSTLAAYYRDFATAATVPVYLYSVPSFTGVALEPDTVDSLATHPGVAGMKDSGGSVTNLVRCQRRTADAAFDLVVGDAGILGQALGVGATGGILALANLLPEACRAVYEARDDPVRARELTADLVEINHALTATYGVPGLKWALRERGVPAGYPRSPHRAPDDEAKAEIRAHLDVID